MKAFAIACLAFAAAATVPADASYIADKYEGMLKSTPGTLGVFAVLDTGTVYHLQSKMPCKVDLENVDLVGVEVRAAAEKGGHAVCNYERIKKGQTHYRDTGAHMVAVTDVSTLEATMSMTAIKAPADASLESLFAGYRSEIEAANPNHAEMPAELQLKDKAGAVRTDYRATGWSIMKGDALSHTELIVGLYNGSILKVVATYPNATIHDSAGSSPLGLKNQLLDIETPYLVFNAAAESMSGTAK